MRLIQNLFFAAAIAALAAGASASPADPRSGAEYLTLAQAQDTEAGDKVEVTEFFSYACPHCNAFEPKLAAWVQKNAGKIAFKRVHVAFRASEQPLQRLYSTLEAMGITEKVHPKVFEAVHEQHIHMASDEAVFDWVAKAGIDRAKFIDTYRSFGMQARINRSRALTAAYKIDSWPMIAVGGRYMTAPHLAGSTTPGLVEGAQHQAALTVMDHLVAKAKTEKK